MKDYQTTKRRTLTKRGVIWLGQTCNLRCHFCYFMDRIASKNHPEHPFMDIYKAKEICKILVDFYGNKAVDLQGGEPTIYPNIHELISYCGKIGLLPTIITNGIVLDNKDKCKQLLDSGIRDCLISVHGLGDTYDKIVGLPGAHKRQMNAIENLIEIGIPFRFNCVLSKSVLKQLLDITDLAIKTNTRVVNFIAFNPFEDQQKKGKRSNDNVPLYTEVAYYLNQAMDVLDSYGIEYNVRYFPICMVAEKHRKAVYNFQQLPYDIHEWDYASWSWTGLQPQRMKDGELTPPISIEEANVKLIGQSGKLVYVANNLKDILKTYPTLLNFLIRINRKISIFMKRCSTNIQSTNNIEQLYNENAKIRAKDHCKYVFSDKCSICDVNEICDGFHGDYAYLFGSNEANPIKIGKKVLDPKFFISNQYKIVEREDYDWAL